MHGAKKAKIFSRWKFPAIQFYIRTCTIRSVVIDLCVCSSEITANFPEGFDTSLDQWELAGARTHIHSLN